MTMSKYSLSGAIIISCIFDRMRKNVNSSVSSIVRTTEDAFSASCETELKDALGALGIRRALGPSAECIYVGGSYVWDPIDGILLGSY